MLYRQAVYSHEMIALILMKKITVDRSHELVSPERRIDSHCWNDDLYIEHR